MSLTQIRIEVNRRLSLILDCCPNGSLCVLYVFTNIEWSLKVFNDSNEILVQPKALNKVIRPLFSSLDLNSHASAYKESTDALENINRAYKARPQLKALLLECLSEQEAEDILDMLWEL